MATKSKNNFTNSQKLSEALVSIKKAQDKHQGVIESKDLLESHRIPLSETGFITLEVTLTEYHPH